MKFNRVGLAPRPETIQSTHCNMSSRTNTTNTTNTTVNSVNARDHLIAMKSSDALNGTAVAVIERLLQLPDSEVDLVLLTGTRDQVGRKRWEKLTRSITRSWTRMFIRFIDGDIQNCNILNLTGERPDDVLVKNWANPEWRVDWDMDLSDDEAQIVLNPEWRKGLRFA